MPPDPISHLAYLMTYEGGCNKKGKFLLIFFRVSDHLEQFGGVLFSLVKLIILTDGGYHSTKIIFKIKTFPKLLLFSSFLHLGH